MPSRISGACNGCRTKKQKCSGDRSGCLQCQAAGIVCTWPEQRKRGPAKGYIEGLEHRLHEAETLLLNILPVLSESQLNTATFNMHASSTSVNGNNRDSPDRQNRSSPPVLNKKTGIEYWENFPLDTADNIRHWQADCALHSQSRDESAGAGAGAGTSSIRSRPNSMDVKRDSDSAGLPTTNGPNHHRHHRAQSNNNEDNRSPNLTSHFRPMSTDPYQFPSPNTAATMQHDYDMSNTSNPTRWHSTPVYQTTQRKSLTMNNNSNNNKNSTNPGSVAADALLLQNFSEQSWPQPQNQDASGQPTTSSSIAHPHPYQHQHQSSLDPDLDMAGSGGGGGGAATNAGAAAAMMDVDVNNFFSHDMRRSLFW